jgi:ribonuclease HI
MPERWPAAPNGVGRPVTRPRYGAEVTDQTATVDIYTDGACSPNPGPGGWGALLVAGGVEQELCGGEAATTTNNRMELTAPARALDSLAGRRTVRLYTDSTYVRDGITKWMLKWKANGWQTASKQPVKNVDLWRLLDTAVRRHDVQWHWVKGHAGHPGNERADRLAAKGMAEAVTGIPAVAAGAGAALLGTAVGVPQEELSAADEPWPTLF